MRNCFAGSPAFLTPLDFLHRRELTSAAAGYQFPKRTSTGIPLQGSFKLSYVAGPVVVGIHYFRFECDHTTGGRGRRHPSVRRIHDYECYVDVPQCLYLGNALGHSGEIDPLVPQRDDIAIAAPLRMKQGVPGSGGSYEAIASMRMPATFFA